MYLKKSIKFKVSRTMLPLLVYTEVFYCKGKVKGVQMFTFQGHIYLK